MCYLKNHQQHPNKLDTRLKVVVWSVSRDQWAGVSKATRKREDDIGSGTFQIVETGDILLISHVTDDGTTIVSAQQVERAVSSHDGNIERLELCDIGLTHNLGKIFQGIGSTLWAWLLNLEDPTDGFLPPGIGWDGKLTLYDQRKRENIRNLLYGCTNDELITTLVDAGQISAGSEVPTNWSEATVLPYDEDTTVDTNVTPITTSVYCIQWFKDNEVVVSTIDENLNTLKYLPVDKTATKVMVGEINETDYNDKKLTRWRLYSR